MSTTEWSAHPIVRRPGVTLHHQLSEALRRYAMKVLRPNEAIPTEGELEERFGVSRATVRRAIDDLVAEGILFRQQGKGTFVCERKLTYEPAKLASWTESISAVGLAPRTGTVRLQQVVAPEWVRDRLRLASGEPVVWLWRLRLAGDEPVSIMVNYLPPRLVPGFVERGLAKESLYDELRETYHLPIVRAEDEVEAQIASDDEAALLGIRPGGPLLEVRRTTYLVDGVPAEAAVVRSRADRYRYRASFADHSVDLQRRP
jgi:GntR family transcriptional regulator